MPGLLRDKCIELVKTLPKPQRKRFVPVPDYVDRALPLMDPCSGSLTSALGAALCRVGGGASVATADWHPERLDPFYSMHFSVIDGEGNIIGSGRDLNELAAQFEEQLQALVEPAADHGQAVVHKAWDFGSWQPTRKLKQGNMRVDVYSALVDNGAGVTVEVRDTPDEAQALSRMGLARLCLLDQPRTVKALKKIFLAGSGRQKNTVQLQLTSLAPYPGLHRPCLWDDFLLAVFADHVVQGEQLPADEKAFASLLRERGNGVFATGLAWHDVLREVIALLYQISVRRAQLDAKTWQYAIDDIGQQWDGLVFEHFLRHVSFGRFQHYPRYLRALLFRLERLEGHYQKDLQATNELARHTRRLLERGGDGALRLPQGTAMARYRWLLEEYRVSLFAQSVGASEPVSGKRLDRLWQDLVD